VVVRYALPGGAKKSDQLNHGIWVGVRKAAGGKGTDWYLAAPGKSGKKDPANNPPPELSYKLDEDPEGFAVLTFTSWPKGDPLIWGD
jgi:hypothetical protein